jgi:hypothetical protein
MSSASELCLSPSSYAQAPPAHAGEASVHAMSASQAAHLEGLWLLEWEAARRRMRLFFAACLVCVAASVGIALYVQHSARQDLASLSASQDELSARVSQLEQELAARSAESASLNASLSATAEAGAQQFAALSSAMSLVNSSLFNATNQMNQVTTVTTLMISALNNASIEKNSFSRFRLTTSFEAQGQVSPWVSEHGHGLLDVVTDGSSFIVQQTGSYLIGIQLNSYNPAGGYVHGWIDGPRLGPPGSRICVFEMRVGSLAGVTTSSVEPVRLLQGSTLTVQLHSGRLEGSTTNPVYVWFKRM